MRSVLCCLSQIPGLRTCLTKKISNSEAHADNIYSSPERRMDRHTQLYLPFPKGDVYKHIPRTSTVASSLLVVQSVRSSEPSDERQVNAFLQYVMILAFPHPISVFNTATPPHLARRELPLSKHF